MVPGDADPNDWSRPSGDAGASGPLHLLAPDWVVPAGDLERHRILRQMEEWSQGINRCRHLDNNRVDGRQLCPNFVLAE